MKFKISVAAVLFLASVALAQEQYGNIRGVVVDNER